MLPIASPRKISSGGKVLILIYASHGFAKPQVKLTQVVGSSGSRCSECEKRAPLFSRCRYAQLVHRLAATDRRRNINVTRGPLALRHSFVGSAFWHAPQPRHKKVKRGTKASRWPRLLSIANVTLGIAGRKSSCLAHEQCTAYTPPEPKFRALILYCDLADL